MTYRTDHGSGPASQAADGASALAGGAAHDTATTEIAVRDALCRIEDLLCAERKRRAQAGLPDLVLPDGLVAKPPVRGRRRRGARRTGHARTPLARLRAWRPGPVHGAWTALFAAVLVWPGTVLTLLFAGFVICLAGVALFGPEILERLRDRAGRLVGRGGDARGEADEEELPEPDPDPFEQRLRDLRDLRG